MMTRSRTGGCGKIIGRLHPMSLCNLIGGEHSHFACSFVMVLELLKFYIMCTFLYDLGQLVLHLLVKIKPYLDKKHTVAFLEKILSHLQPICDSSAADFITSILETIVLTQSSEQLEKESQEAIAMNVLDISDSAITKLIELTVELDSAKLDCVTYSLLVARVNHCGDSLCISQTLDVSFCNHPMSSPPEHTAGMKKLLHDSLQPKKLFTAADCDHLLRSCDQTNGWLSRPVLINLLNYCLIALNTVRAKIAAVLLNFDEAVEHLSGSAIHQLCEMAEGESDHTHLHACLYLVEKFLSVLQRKHKGKYAFTT